MVFYLWSAKTFKVKILHIKEAIGNRFNCKNGPYITFIVTSCRRRKLLKSVLAGVFDISLKFLCYKRIKNFKKTVCTSTLII